jgi:hypothetical protein
MTFQVAIAWNRKDGFLSTVIVGLGVRERRDGAESLHEALRVDFLGRRVIAVQANQHLQRFPLHIVSRIGLQYASLQASSSPILHGIPRLLHLVA